MSAAVIAQLLAQFGLPLTQYIYGLFQSGNKPVSPEDFAALMQLSQYRSTDSLTAAGIKIVDGKVMPIVT